MFGGNVSKVIMSYSDMNEKLQANNEELQSVIDALNAEIEERKRAEEALAEAERKYRELVRYAPAAIFEIDFHSKKFITVNDAMCEMTGYSREELLETNPFDLLDEEGRAVFQSRISKWLSGIEPEKNVEYKIKTKDSRIMYVILNVTFTTDEQGNPIGAMVIGHDVTERRQVEEALRSVALFPDENPNPVLRITAEGNVLYANPASRIFLSECGSDSEGRLPEELITAAANALSTGSDKEVEIDCRDRTISFVIAAIEDQGYVNLYGRDITERKQAEKTIRESESRLKRSQEIAHLGSWELDLATNELTWSDEVYRIFGLAPQEFGATYEAFLERVHPNDRAAVDDAYSGSLRDNLDSYEIEHRIVRKDTGEIRIVHERCEHMRDDKGVIIRSVGMVHDITERKQAEEELRRRAEEVETVMDVAPVAIWVGRDPKNDDIIGNRMANAFYEAEVGENVSANVSKVRRFFQGDRELAAEELPMQQASALNAEVRDVEFDVLMPSGNRRTLWGHAAPLRHPDGQVRGSVGAFLDITERKQVEQTREDLLQREHKIANMLQSVLIPDTRYEIPGTDIAVRYEPAYEEANVGGDFYDVFDLGNGKFGILIGDVAGKGLSAAIRVAAVRYSIRAHAYLDPRPAKVLELTNNVLCKEYDVDAPMITAAFSIVDIRLGTITYASGGHEPVILRKENGEVEELKGIGRALGVMPGGAYEEDSRRLSPGDLVVMVTDGITEARDSDGRMFDMSGVVDSLKDAERIGAEEAADKILSAAKEHSNGALRDDAAIVIFGLKKEKG